MKDKSTISIVATEDRGKGIRRAVELLNLKHNPLAGRDVLIKPNLNTADPYPASSHPDTMEAILELVSEMGAKSMALGDRSGPADTGEVMKELGLPAMCKRHGAKLINFEELPPDKWQRMRPPVTHWSKGFLFARPVMEAGAVVSTCCLKTHGFGGVFTMSLKLSIGAVHGSDMRELHSSFISMRKMIAEVNTAYSPALIVMDAIEAFTDKGPMSGPMKHAGLILAGTDRVAMDATGIAILKHLKSNKAIMDKPIYEQEQIAHAVELKLGAASPDEIELLHSPKDAKMVAKLRAILDRG